MKQENLVDFVLNQEISTLKAEVSRLKARLAVSDSLLKEESDSCLCIFADIKGKAGANLKQESLCSPGEECWWCRVRLHLKPSPASTLVQSRGRWIILAARLTDEGFFYYDGSNRDKPMGSPVVFDSVESVREVYAFREEDAREYVGWIFNVDTGEAEQL